MPGPPAPSMHALTAFSTSSTEPSSNEGSIFPGLERHTELFLASPMSTAQSSDRQW